MNYETIRKHAGYLEYAYKVINKTAANTVVENEHYANLIKIGTELLEQDVPSNLEKEFVTSYKKLLENLSETRLEITALNK